MKMTPELIITPARRLMVVLVLGFIGTGIVYNSLKKLNVDSAYVKQNNPHKQDEKWKSHKVTSDDSNRIHTYPPLGTDSKFLHIFVQISDLHLSIYRDKLRGPDFREFCQHYLPVIQPKLILATGDLTDAKTSNKLDSMQYEEEWRNYRKILEETNVTKRYVWLDLPGNHDTFDVVSAESNNNYIRDYSIQWKNYRGMYSHLYTGQEGDTVSFVVVDASLEPGPRRPFNFFGVITQEKLESLRKLAGKASNSNVTVFFGHYPTSVMTGDVDQLRHILGQGMVYLPGHLHTLGGLVPNMYTIQQTGYLELEVGDWMDNRIYRIFAIDHGMFSFVDVSLGQWPVILITNPKHGQFIIPGKEPLGAMLQSTHIRILVFSTKPIKNVTVNIDGTMLGVARHVKDTLYTVPWKPEMYTKGEHRISVYAQDASGSSATQTQPFVLDDTHLPFNLLRRFLLMSHHPTEAKVMFFFAWLGTVLPMLIMKFINVTVEVTPQGDSSCCHCVHRLIQKIFRKYKMLAKKNNVFWPLLMLHIYVALGPWFIGELLRGHIGCMFVYGLYVHGTFIPGSLTFLYGFFQLLLFNLPVTLYLAHVIDMKSCGHKRVCVSWPRAFVWLWQHGVFVALVALQLFQAYLGFYETYGLMAVLLCPVRVGSALLAIILRRFALHNSTTKGVTPSNDKQTT